jgi:hypothetical protein
MTWIPSDKPAVTLADSKLEEMSKNERIEVASKGLFFVSDGETTHPFSDELDETIGRTSGDCAADNGIYDNSWLSGRANGRLIRTARGAGRAF